MNSIARQRSALIEVVTGLDATFQCTYEYQFNSQTGKLFSDAFERDVRREHAIFVMMLDSESSTSETFITFFKDDSELLEYLLTTYLCYQLREDMLPSLRQMNNRNRG